MYKLKISPKAMNDLVEIKSYIFQELCNLQAAINLVSKIMKKYVDYQSILKLAHN